MARTRLPATPPPEAPSGFRAFTERHSRSLTWVAAALVLAAGIVWVRRYWRGVMNERAGRELARILAMDADAQRPGARGGGPFGPTRASAMPDHTQAEYLEQLARDFAGSDASPEIRYRLGCAYLQSSRLDMAVMTFKQVAADAPGTIWAEKAGDAAGRVASVQARQALDAEQVKSLKAQAQAQRLFQTPPPAPDPRGAAIPAPVHPDTGSAAQPLDPARSAAIQRP